MRRFYHAIAVLMLASLLWCGLATVAFAAEEHPAASASASASALPKPGAADVRIREKVVLVFHVARGGRSAEERARGANTAIEAALSHPDELGDVRWEDHQGAAVVYVGKAPIVTLGPEDAEAAGEPSVAVFAAQTTSKISDAFANERKRSAIATTVFRFSLVVFSALLAFLLLGRASEVAGRVRTWLSDNPERVTGVRLGKVDLLSAGASRGALMIALTLGYRLVQVAIAYAWLIVALSLFDATRGYTEKLTGLVIAPLYALAGRIGSALPLLVIAAIAGIAVTVFVRFIGLFFDSVGRGDTKVIGLPRDLARPTSLLVRIGVVLVALVIASPLITGSDDGALARAGLLVLFAVALASTPLLASAAVGVSVVYGRRLAKGDLVEFGGRSGRIIDVGLLDVRLEDASASEVSVPHLLCLVHPTRIHRHPPLGTIDVVVPASAKTELVEKALLDAAREISSRGRVELVRIDDAGAHWRITSAAQRGELTLAAAIQRVVAKFKEGAAAEA